MIIKIVCASSDAFSKLYSYDEEEFLIGVDGGADILIKKRLPINLAIGDFDSSKLEDIRSKASELILYPPHKNKSDFELAILHVFSPEFQKRYLGKRGIEKIIVYNATGRRLDHYRAIINVLVRYTHLPIEIIDTYNRIYVVNSNTTFKKNKYPYISFFAVDPQTIISLKGFKYDLNDYELGQYDNLCLSNEIISDNAELITNNKKILVIQSK